MVAGGQAKVIYATIKTINSSLHTCKYKVIGFYNDVTDRTELFNIKVGHNTFIGVKATILRVTVGRNCIVGAGSLVNKDIPDSSKAMGIPAKSIPTDGKISFGSK